MVESEVVFSPTSLPGSSWGTDLLLHFVLSSETRDEEVEAWRYRCSRSPTDIPPLRSKYRPGTCI